MPLKPRSFFYFLHEAFLGLVRNRLMTLTAMGIITVGLFLFGLFFLVTANLRYFTDLAWSEMELRVFLKPTATNQAAIGNQLSALPGVQNVTFIPKAEGAVALEKMFNNKHLFLDGENPLPDAFNLTLMKNVDPEALSRLVTTIPGVDEIVFGQDFVKFMEIAIRLVLIAGLILLFLTGLAVLYIVVNTIQLTVYSRRKEIEIMKLVGATDSFVRWPFLLEGMILGLLGAGLALLLLNEGYAYLVYRLQHYRRFLPLLTGEDIKLILAVTLLSMGLFFGGFGSHISLKRYLKV